MAKVDEKRRHKILNGNMWTAIIAMCAPLFIYQLFNAFYSLVDTIFASEISTDSVSSVAALGQVKSLLTSFGAGIAAGGGIIVARRFGAGDFNDARKNANASFSLVLVVSIAIAFICIPLAYPICSMSGISDAQAAKSTGYFIIQMLEVVIVSMNSVFIALQKAKGNTKSIFYLNFVAMGVKLFLNWIFIYVIGVDEIIWIAVATLLSQLALFLILGGIMVHKNNIFRITPKMITLRWRYIKPILAISIPIFIGKFVFSFGKVAVNSIFGQGYEEILLSQIDMSDPEAVAQAQASAGLVVGALAVSNNLNGIITSPTNTFEETESTIISQNIGNRNLKRAMQAFWKTFILCFITGTIGWILIRFTFQTQLINLFKDNDIDASQSAEFMEYVRRIHAWDSLSIPSLAINAACLGVLYGFGKTKIAAFINVARAFIFRIPVLIILLEFFPELGVEVAGYSMGISNIGIMIMSIVCLIIFYFQIKKKGYDGMYLDGRDEKNITNTEEIELVENEEVIENNENDNGV
ncbi:MAG: hypothetical protein IJY14_01325 [Acholeplasmatales bacterium]|nr:hypothetical protein [Acholeplasmatales bacterium]